MKKFFAILLSIILIFNFSVCTYADTIDDNFEHYEKTKEYLWKIVGDIGFIGTLPFRGIVELVNMFKHSKGITGEDVSTDEEALDYAYRGISINGDNNIVLADDAKQFLNFWIKDTIDNSDPYVTYSFDLSDYTGNFANAQIYDGLVNLCQTYQDSYQIIKFGNNGQVCLLPVGQYAGLYYIGSDIAYQSNVYSLSNWTGTPNDDDFRYFVFDNGVYVEQPLYKTPLTAVYSQVSNKINGNNIGTVPCYISYGTNYDVLIFRDLANLRTWSKGRSPYYFNNQVYSNYSNSVGDYTITSDNSNKVTIGDINTYIDDHHIETGEYPSTPEINVYIENYLPDNPSPNPDNPSGGGSSGGATATANNEGININIENNHNINIGIPSLSGNNVSGNGSGSSGGIFGWISDIGGVIGDFIKNVGELIADVIKGITETITTVLADIPNIISMLVEFVYGGLPDELKAIVTLGITTVIFVGVIKMMRK